MASYPLLNVRLPENLRRFQILSHFQQWHFEHWNKLIELSLSLQSINVERNLHPLPTHRARGEWQLISRNQGKPSRSLTLWNHWASLWPKYTCSWYMQRGERQEEGNGVGENSPIQLSDSSCPYPRRAPCFKRIVIGLLQNAATLHIRAGFQGEVSMSSLRHICHISFISLQYYVTELGNFTATGVQSHNLLCSQM